MRIAGSHEIPRGFGCGGDICVQRQQKSAFASSKRIYGSRGLFPYGRDTDGTGYPTQSS